MTDSTSGELIRPLLIIEQLIDRLAEDIIEGKIPAGSQLIEIELQKRFGVSRTPLREAFRELERKGFVTIIPRRGAFVKELSEQEVIDIYEMRAALEGLAARLSFEKNSSCKDKLTDHMHRMEKAYSQKNRSEFLKAHDCFHDVWILNSQNAALIEECHRLRGLTSWHRIFFKFAPVNFANAIEAHKKILDAFCSACAGSEEVEKAVKENVRSAISRVLHPEGNYQM